MAEMRYDRQGASIFTVIASVIIVLVVAYLATLFVPFVISEFS
jgi:competence protein ComGC